MVGADLRTARQKQTKRTARPEVGPYRHADPMRSFLPANSIGQDAARQGLFRLQGSDGGDW